MAEILCNKIPFEGGIQATSVEKDLVFNVNRATTTPYTYNGSSGRSVTYTYKKISVNASAWTSTVDSDGYYTNSVYIGLLNNNLPVNIYLAGSTNSNVPTDAEIAAYRLLCVATVGASILFKAKVKPTTTFYVNVEGMYIGT